jgi:hypothetical protein
VNEINARTGGGGNLDDFRSLPRVGIATKALLPQDAVLGIGIAGFPRRLRCFEVIQNSCRGTSRHQPQTGAAEPAGQQLSDDGAIHGGARASVAEDQRGYEQTKKRCKPRFYQDLDNAARSERCVFHTSVASISFVKDHRKSNTISSLRRM